MVEAAKAHNPFATQAQIEASNCCPHMARLGVCLEPEMCFLIHIIPAGSSGAAAPIEMSTQAKSFNPFASNSGTISTQAKAFVPGQQD